MGHFYPFTLSTYKPKKSEFWKMKKNCWRYHFIQVYQKPQSYEVQFLRHRVRQTEFFVILGNSFTPLTTTKIKISQKWKKHLEMLSFYTCVPKIIIIWCLLPEIWNTTDNFLSFQAIFCPFTPLLTSQKKFGNKCKKDLDILSYYKCVP